LVEVGHGVQHALKFRRDVLVDCFTTAAKERERERKKNVSEFEAVACTEFSPQETEFGVREKGKSESIDVRRETNNNNKRNRRETQRRRRRRRKSRTLDVLLQVRHRAVHRVKKGGGGL